MQETDWHHAPLHRFVPSSVHMVTAGTFEKKHLFYDYIRLTLLMDTLIECVDRKGWRLHAWACMANHIHWIAMAPEEGNLGHLIKELHSKLGLRLNLLDGTKGRKVMHQFWDSCISYDNSYYARMNYVMNNPVKHGLVEDARHYPFCSASWFQDHNPSHVRRKFASYAYDNVNVPDEY